MRNRGIYRKILFILLSIGLIFVILPSSLYFYKKKEEKLIFKESEKQFSTELKTLISISGREIVQTVYDYTYWDEFVDNVTENDSTWFENNIATVIDAFNADYVCVYDTTFNLVYESSVDSFTNRNFISKESILKLKESKLMNFYLSDSNTIIEISGGSIHPTNDPTRTLTKPSGYFFISRDFKTHVIDDISKLLEAKYRIISPGDSVSGVDKFTLSSSIVLNDWQNQLISKIVFDKKSQSLELYSNLSRNMFFILLFSLLFTWLIIQFSLRYWVINPLKLVLDILKTEDPKLIKQLQKTPGEFEKLGILFEQNIIQKKELTLSKEKAEESDRLKLAFLANMSHEIRTPMNGILGFASLLRDQKIGEKERREYLDIILQSGDRMLNLINDIMNISKIEAGQVKVVLSETNLKDQVEYIYSFFKPEAEQKGLNLFLKNEHPVEPLNIVSDKEKIYAILINLVKNAIKFTNSGSVKFGYEKKGNFIEFFVSDTGVGVRKDHQQVIFERFRQGNETLTRNYEGSGLGLSISKAYVEMLGGKIWLESELGKGSVFYFTIPFTEKLK